MCIIYIYIYIPWVMVWAWPFPMVQFKMMFWFGVVSFFFLIKYYYKRHEFFFLLCKDLFFILSYITVEGLYKIYNFLIWFSNFFFSSDLILIKNQLILIFYKKMRLKEEEPKLKDTIHEWYVISLTKNTL